MDFIAGLMWGAAIVLIADHYLIEDEPTPQAPATMEVDGHECRLWPLDADYGSADPAYFWLCDTGEYGLAWTQADIQPGEK